MYYGVFPPHECNSLRRPLSGLVDDQKFEDTFYEFGIRQYRTAGGVKKSVRAFTRDPESAVVLGLCQIYEKKPAK